MPIVTNRFQVHRAAIVDYLESVAAEAERGAGQSARPPVQETLGRVEGLRRAAREALACKDWETLRARLERLEETLGAEHARAAAADKARLGGCLAGVEEALGAVERALRRAERAKEAR